MSEPSQAPPLQWILGGIASVVIALWAALRSDRTKEIARLEASLKHEQDERTRERQEAKEALERLGIRLDQLQEARAQDQMRMARALFLARSETAERKQWEAEAPTGVRDILGLTDPHASWGKNPHPKDPWDPNLSTPPRPRPRPRGR